ncbi:DNA-binding transcriptional LysR family regulator [Sporomusaceae bacterium BoRhaA]|uniref:LysR family transcriptional regulator n=1 Tax=Pelorhabdus rhamnosifermentans TaxID=2772457 RepID=UPI001C0629D0|nr:LysR family transcriptional regulator [Pelorhabdus rhamnosifermentans]MBU2700039.1 DNA-binding transcriptional LysR family regulator [Pelorhabdus rhamnosifermentans]
MNSKELQYIIEISEEQSISNAAKKLFVSQSTLSHSLNKIEEKLGTPLFDRSTIPLKLTYAGKLFVDTAQKIVTLNKELYQQIQDVADFKRGSFTIGVTHLAERYYLPLVLPHFRKKYPGIDIIIKVASLAKLEILLLKRMVDFSIIIPFANPDIEYKPIFKMDILLAIPIDHPLNKKNHYAGHQYPELDLKELANEEFIILQQGRKLRETAITACKAAGFTPKIALEVSNLDTAHALVAEGYGVTFLLDVITYNAPRKDRVAYFRIKNSQLHQTFCLGHLKNKYLPKVVDEFLNAKKIL